MRIIVFFLLFLHCISCKPVTSETYVPDGTIDTSQVIISEVRAKDSLDSIKVVATVPKQIIQQKEDLKEEKEEDSPFRKLGCCDTEGPTQLCCCEPILKEYISMAGSLEQKKLSDIRAQDPYLSACYTKFPDFKRKLDELEMGEEE